MTEDRGPPHPSAAPVPAPPSWRGNGLVATGVLHEPRAYATPGERAGTVCRVSLARRCSRTACSRAAVATLTYVYADQTAVLGPLATYAEPHAYDLCDLHSERLSAPRGWEVLRLSMDQAAPSPTEDDLLALANAVREAARPVPVAQPVRETGREVARKGHLRVLTTD